MEFDFLVAMGYLAKTPASEELCRKEIAEADYDLEVGGKSIAEGDAKWSIIKAYYSMFHAAKGVLFLLGFKEKSHRGLAEALEVLCKQGKLESRYANDFRAAMSMREGADYSYSHSEQSAKDVLTMAGEFLKRMKALAKGLGKF